MAILGKIFKNLVGYEDDGSHILISSDGGSASTLDKNAIETDDLILMHFDFTAIPTITGGSG